MSTTPPQASPSLVSPSQAMISSVDESSGRLFDAYPNANIILLSCDSHEFAVPDLYIIHSSPVLAELVRNVSVSSGVATSKEPPAESPLATVQLTDSRIIISSLLSFILPVTPSLPSTTEQIMELLSVARKYEMGSVLTRIRDRLYRQDPPFIRPENAFHVYSLAQQYRLRDEARRAARGTLTTSVTLEDLDDQLEIMPGAFLYELWKYQQRVRGNLVLDLLNFRMTGARDALKGADLHCIKMSSLGIPSWLDEYIESLVKSPAYFDLTKFHMALTRHTAFATIASRCPSCASITSEVIHTFWAAVTAVVHNSFGRAESDLLLVASYTRPRSHSTTAGEPSPPPEGLNFRDADVILRSSDPKDFRVHKAVLATSSPFFSDMFSLARPSDDEIVDGLPVVYLSENAEVLHSLVSILYPIPSVIPDSYDKVIDLLGTSQKYDMAAVQSSIRAEVSRKTFPTLLGNGTFRAYAVAHTKQLTPEMENASRLTLDHPMTFEFIGDEVGFFDGWALRNLARFRKRCRDSIVLCLETFMDPREGPSKVWVGCPHTNVPTRRCDLAALPGWLDDFISSSIQDLKNSFTRPLLERSSFRKQYLIALKAHVRVTNCAFCARQHAIEGESYLEQLLDSLTQARDTVPFDAES